MKRLMLFVIALALMSTRALAQGGTIGGGGSGGGNVVVTDSLKRLANGTAAAPSLAFLNSAGTGLNRFGADTLGFATGGVHSLRISGGATPTIAGGAGNMTILAGTGNSRSIVFQSTTSAGVATNTASVQVDGSNVPYLHSYGSIRTGTTPCGATVSYHSNAGTGHGLCFPGGDTVAIANTGAPALRVTGGASATLVGGAGNMTIQAGTGASRLLVFQSTTSGGVATNSFVINATQDIAMSNNGSNSNRVLLSPGNSVSAPGIAWTTDENTGLARLGADTLDIVTGGTARARWATNAATGAGDVALCITTADVITKGATCGSSSRKVKTDIATLSPILATRALALRPVSFRYAPGFYGGTRTYGLIAEEAARVDSTFVYYAETDQKLANGQTIKKGEPYNVNDRAVLASLLALVQQQQQDIDQLRKVLLGLLGAGGAAGVGLAGWRKRKAA